MIEKEMALVDGVEYIMAEEIIYNDTQYNLLIKENDNTDFLIKKIKKQDNQLIALDNEEEFATVYKLFLEKIAKYTDVNN